MCSIILSRLDYVKGGSLNLSHSQGQKGYLWACSEGQELTEESQGSRFIRSSRVTCPSSVSSNADGLPDTTLLPQ